MTRQGLWPLGRKPREARYRFSSHRIASHGTGMTSLVTSVLSSWLSSVVRFLHHGITPPPFHSALWKEVTTCSMHIRGGKLCSISLRTEHLHKVFGIFLHRRYVSSPPFTYLFSYLFLLPGDFCLHVVFHLATCLVLIRRHSHYVPS